MSPTWAAWAQQKNITKQLPRRRGAALCSRFCLKDPPEPCTPPAFAPKITSPSGDSETQVGRKPSHGGKPSNGPFPCSTASTGVKPQPTELKSSTRCRGAAGHVQVSQEKLPSSSPQAGTWIFETGRLGMARDFVKNTLLFFEDKTSRALIKWRLFNQKNSLPLTILGLAKGIPRRTCLYCTVCTGCMSVYLSVSS